MAEVRAEREGAAGFVTLSQPDRLNALTLAMWRELRDAVVSLARDPIVRVIVVRGEGGADFSAGADISEFSRVRGSAGAAQVYTGAVGDALQALLDARRPTIAQVHGACVGGGAAIAVACMMRFVDDGLRFAITAARLGVVYEGEAIGALVRLVGPGRALDILLSGRSVGAAEALRIGLANEVVSAPELETRVREYAEILAANAPISMEGAIVAVRAAQGRASAESEAELRELKRKAIESDDYREGTQAFLDKRRPRFTGR